MGEYLGYEMRERVIAYVLVYQGECPTEVWDLASIQDLRREWFTRWD